MKKNLFFILSLWLICACNKAPHYSIEGKIIGDLEGKKVYLLTVKNGIPDSQAKDSTVIHKGIFKFEGVADTTEFCFLEIEGQERPMIFILENTLIKVTYTADNFLKSSISSPQNDAFYKYVINFRSFESLAVPIIEEVQSYKGEMTPEKEKELSEEMEIIRQKIGRLQIKFLQDNKNTLASTYAMLMSMAIQIPSLEELQVMYKELPDSLKRSAYGKELGKHLGSVGKQLIGIKYTDVSGKTPAGETISLSMFVDKGNYVLVDFWASWCGPCRHENPHLLDLYNKYKNKNFEIVGISLDSKEDAWKQAVKDDMLTWPQLSELKGFDIPATDIYGIKGIPFTLLLDPEGTIVATNLRGEKLSDTLEKLFGR